MTDSYNANTKTCGEVKVQDEKWTIEKTETETKIETIQQIRERKLKDIITVNEVVTRMTEKGVKRVSGESMDVMQSILDFVLNCNFNVDLIRKIMHHQVI